jgi:hypothetical protein
MKYITLLDMMRFWERAIRRAKIPIAYSEGFSPHAQIAIAAPLAVGTTSDAELMDVFLEQPMQPRQFIEQLAGQFPPGISIVSAQEVGLALPAMQADIRFAEYLVSAPFSNADDVAQPPSAVRSPHDDASPVAPTITAIPARNSPELSTAVETFLAATEIPWEHKRENETRSYNIRAQVDQLTIESSNDASATLNMRLKNDNTGSGRPEQVAAALGLGIPTRIHRTKIILAPSAVKEAWRKQSRAE